MPRPQIGQFVFRPEEFHKLLGLPEEIQVIAIAKRGILENVVAEVVVDMQGFPEGTTGLQLEYDPEEGLLGLSCRMEEGITTWSRTSYDEFVADIREGRRCRLCHNRLTMGFGERLVEQCQVCAGNQGVIP